MKSIESERNPRRADRRAVGVATRLGRVVLRALPVLGALSMFAGTPDLEPRMLSRMGYEMVELRRTDDHHLYVTGRADGRRVSCLADTGWSFTTLQPNKAGPSPTLQQLQLGRVILSNLPVRVQPVRFNGQPAAFDLVLGLDFLRGRFAVLDCGRRRLFVRRTVLPEVEQAEMETALRNAGYAELPLRLKSPPALALNARINGASVEMLLDSGAAWSCLDQRQCERLNLKPQGSAARITGAGATGIRPIAVAERVQIQLGAVEFTAATLALFDLADWGFAAPGKTLSEVQGILGGEWLAATSAVIDCAQLKLWVKRPARRQ